MKWTWPERPSRPEGVSVAWNSDPDALPIATLDVGDRVTVSADGEWVVVAVDPVRLERPWA